VLPFRVERARLLTRINAPGRKVTVSGRADGRFVEVHQANSPLDPIRLDITEARFLHLDEEGGLHLNLDVSALLRRGGGGKNQKEDKWAIDYLEVEVTGRREGS
jgi:hypothetical protein